MAQSPSRGDNTKYIAAPQQTQADLETESDRPKNQSTGGRGFLAV